MNFANVTLLVFALLLVVEATDKRLKFPKLGKTHFVNEFHTNKKVKLSDEAKALSFLGHGGPYGPVQDLTSRHLTIEADHSPNYGILEYLDLGKVDDVSRVPDTIRDMVAERRRLETELDKTDFPRNAERIKELKKNMDKLTGELDAVMRANKLPPHMQRKYYSNIDEMGKISKDTVDLENKLTTTSDASKRKIFETKLHQNQEQIRKLHAQNTDMTKSFNDPAKLDQLLRTQTESHQLEKSNKILEKDLKAHNTKVQDAMGVLSIPYETHRLFPSTGNAPLDGIIESLKNADYITTKIELDSRVKAWVDNMEEGMKKKPNTYFKNAEDFAKYDASGVKTYDYQKMWETNFDRVMKLTKEAKKLKVSDMKQSDINALSVEKQRWIYKLKYMERLHTTYAKKFMTTAIYYLKAPGEGGGYSRLMNLYLSEYKMYLGSDFDSYKQGISSLLETNKNLGWLTDADVDNLKNHYELDRVTTKRNDDWDMVDKLISDKVEKSSNDLIKTTSGTVCTASRSRGKRSTGGGGGGCIFFCNSCDDGNKDRVGNIDDVEKIKSVDVDEGDSNRKSIVDFEDGAAKSKPGGLEDGETGKTKPVVDGEDESNGKVKPAVNEPQDDVKSKRSLVDYDFDDLSKARILLPLDADTVSIDSKKLSTYLAKLDDSDLDSVRIKESMVEHATRNQDKLTGTPAEIEKAKAVLKQENLDGHAKQNDFASNVFRGGGGDVDGAVSPKALTKYKKMKVSTSRFAAKYQKFTSAAGKFSNSYGKIMIAKGVVTALRHGDYESLALMGGRLALEIPLKGLEKLGKRLAKKLSTKTTGKVLGKIAGPIGDIADIGMNVYSIIKSVQKLNDPNATKREQNEAIADIVADSIDIVVTATASVLSLAFPPLAPVFALAAFAINLLVTLFVSFFKAANHVKELNEELPLLDFERTSEYWRYVRGKDTSGYIRDLIDVKKANNIAVNMTVQFLVNNTDYIGRVFPATTIYDPESICRLEKRSQTKILFAIPTGWENWHGVSACYGVGESCTGEYKDKKCGYLENMESLAAVVLQRDEEYRCRCGQDPPSPSGYDILDNEVDFRETRNVYLDRAGADFKIPSGFEYTCKPSSLENKGHKVSNPYTNHTYSCKSAVAVRRESGGGKFMLYDLGKGTDTVTLNEKENVDNLFVVKDGRKVFQGNAGDDTFLLEGPCEYLKGSLDGKGFKGQGNSLVLGQNCSRSTIIHVDLWAMKLSIEEEAQAEVTVEEPKLDEPTTFGPEEPELTTEGPEEHEMTEEEYDEFIFELVKRLNNSVVSMTTTITFVDPVEEHSPEIKRKKQEEFMAKYGGAREVELKNIERVIGRKEGTDWIKGNCNTKLIAGGGGSSQLGPDVIAVPSCDSDTFEMTVAVDGSNHFNASDFLHGKVFVLLSGYVQFRSMVSTNFGGTLVFKFEKSAGNLTSSNVDADESSLTIGFSDGGNATFQFVENRKGSPSSAVKCGGPKPEGSQITILINDTRKLGTQLPCNLDHSLRLQCTLVLKSEVNNQSSSIQGYDFLDNVFHLKSGKWNVSGGNMSNMFVLMSSEFSGVIDGGGHGSMHITDEFSDVENLEINLNSVVLHGKQDLKFSNIHGVIGRPGHSDHVTTSCTTKSLDLGGTAPDRVDIPCFACENPVDIRISVRGNVTIRDLKVNGTTTIQAGIYGGNDCSNGTSTEPPLDLHISHSGGGQNILLLNLPVHKLLHASTSELNLEGGNRVKLEGPFPNVNFEEDHGQKCSLVVSEGKFIALHELENVSPGPKLRKASSAVASNVFKLVGGTEWTVVGGSCDDTFSMETDIFQGDIDGGSGKNNLFINSQIDGTVTVDTSIVLVEGRKLLSFENIEEIHARSAKADKLIVGCSVKFMNGNGGQNAENPDTVTIPNRHDCNNSQTTIVATGFTKFESFAEMGTFDTYVQPDASENLQFKADVVVVTNSTYFNFPIKYPAFKLISHELKMEMVDSSLNAVRLQLEMSESENMVEFVYKFGNGGGMQNVNMLFVDEDSNSNGNILINFASNELNILHLLQKSESSGGESLALKTRSGATGAKNIFRLNTGNWEAFGGTLDDSFILNEDSFRGKIHGLGGVNSLILAESVKAAEVIVWLPGKVLTLQDRNFSSIISVSSIQIVGGRKLKQDKVICACDTRLVMLDGGASEAAIDVIEIPENFCHPEISMILEAFTRIENNATRGNFTYHVRTSKNFNIKYTPSYDTKHDFKFEIPLEQIKYTSLDGNKLNFKFEDGIKSFPLNFQNLPTFTFGQNQELMGKLILEEGQIPQHTVAARSPFSGSIHGLNGVENWIVVETTSDLQSITGGDKDDSIFLTHVNSMLRVDGMGGTNRLQLAERLHTEKHFEVNLQEERITFIEDSDSNGNDSFVRQLKGIQLFAGRESGFERVVLACDTTSVKFAEEVIIRDNCGYNVKIEVGDGTRVIFDLPGDNTREGIILEDDDTQSATAAAFGEIDREEDGDGDSLGIERTDLLEPSTFHYHFSVIRNFDVEMDAYYKLLNTRHVFYLNFTLSDLKAIRFSDTDSRLTYSTLNPIDNKILEYSHLVHDLNPFSLFYSHPEFMTSEGFQLKITRYGEIIAVIANPTEYLDMGRVQQEIIPWLSEYSSSMGMSFMLETPSDFIYCGSPNDVAVLTNRENVTRSHLIGFNESRYEILGLDTDVFIYPQSLRNDSVHVLDLTSVVYEIRQKTEYKYVPFVRQVGSDLEIYMGNWTDHFPGKIIFVNGTSYHKRITIFLNSIAMELAPIVSKNDASLSMTDRDDPDTNRRHKRSMETHYDDKERTYWQITPRTIFIPEEHSYFLAPDDLEDGVEIKKEFEADENSTFEYSKHENDLVITSAGSAEEIETGRAITFTIFDYYSPSVTPSIMSLESKDNLSNDAIKHFGRVETANNIRVNLGQKVVKVTSNERLVSDAGEEISVIYYEDILDREEFKITKDFPEMKRIFKVSLWKKITRSAELNYLAIAGTILCFILLPLMFFICKISRRNSKKGKYSVVEQQCIHETHNNGVVKMEIRRPSEFYEEAFEDYKEPRLVAGVSLTEDKFLKLNYCS